MVLNNKIAITQFPVFTSFKQKSVSFVIARTTTDWHRMLSVHTWKVHADILLSPLFA